MSNNIYDILKKMQNLVAPKQTLTEGKKAKPDFLDMDKDGDKKEPMKKAAKEKSKGAVAEAVAQVESKLSQKYASFNNVEEGVKPKGSVTTTSSGEEEYKPAPGYRVKAEFEPGAGKPKMGFVKTDTDKEKSQAALPSTTKEKPVDESGLQAYLGKKKYGEQGMQALQKAGRDGASKEKMARIRARHDKMDEGEYNEEMLSAKQKSFAALAEPQDKITYADKIAGAKKGVKKEGNRFSGNLMKARAQGLKQADLDGDGDMEPVREDLPVEPGSQASMARQQASDIEKKLNMDRYRDDLSQRAQKNWDAGQPAREKLAKAGMLDKYKTWMSPEDAGYMVQQQQKKSPQSMREGWEEMQSYLDKKKGPESKGGEGKKAGTRYGGSAQRDDDEETDGEGQAVVKKKGRPKGTGGGAKFSFKKPKD